MYLPQQNVAKAKNVIQARILRTISNRTRIQFIEELTELATFSELVYITVNEM